MDTRAYSREQENRVAKKLNGKVVANSGATAFNKGDVTLPNWLLECKTVTKPQNSITVRKEWIRKNEEEAFSMNKEHSAVVINFGDKDDYYIINQQEFQRFIELLGKEGV